MRLKVLVQKKKKICKKKINKKSFNMNCLKERFLPIEDLLHVSIEDKCYIFG